MLDPNHPMTAHVFSAGTAIGGLSALGQEMSVAPSTVRLQLLARTGFWFARMRELNRDHFGDSQHIAKAIDDYEAALGSLAALGDGKITEDRRDGEGNCPYCGSKITKVNSMPGFEDPENLFIMIFCQRCTELFMPAHNDLSGCTGVDFI